MLLPRAAKRFVEQAALWRAAPAFDDTAGWGTPGAAPAPMVVAGQLAAEQGAGGLFVDDLTLRPSGPNDERWLELGGWKSPTGTPETGVDPGTTNRYANRDELKRLADTALSAGEFCYHAEFFDNARLTALAGRCNLLASCLRCVAKRSAGRMGAAPRALKKARERATTPALDIRHHRVAPHRQTPSADQRPPFVHQFTRIVQRNKVIRRMPNCNRPTAVNVTDCHESRATQRNGAYLRLGSPTERRDGSSNPRSFAVRADFLAADCLGAATRFVDPAGLLGGGR